MTHKHFNAIADTFRRTQPDQRANAAAQYQWMYDVYSMADTLKMFNRAFDRARFMAACKGE